MRLPTEDAKRERIIAEQNTNEGGTDQTEDLNPHNTVNVAIQTDLTAAEIGGLECDYQKKTEEFAEITVALQKDTQVRMTSREMTNCSDFILVLVVLLC